MKRILTALALAASCGAANATACESLTVNILPFEVVEDHTWTVRQLTEKANGAGMALGAMLGAVFATSTVAVQGCTVTAGYANVTLRVAADLVGDKCAFEHVYRHEQGHIRIYREHLATLAARIQRLAGAPNLPHAVMRELMSAQKDHAAHDSPAEYDTNRTACDGRILALSGFRFL